MTRTKRATRKTHGKRYTRAVNPSSSTVVKGLERLFQALMLKPFEIEVTDDVEDEATWPDYFEEKFAVVRRRYVLALIEHAEQRRLVLDVKRTIHYLDPNEDMDYINHEDLEDEVRFFLTDAPKKDGLPTLKLLKELHLVALHTLASYDNLDASNYPEVTEHFERLRKRFTTDESDRHDAANSSISGVVDGVGNSAAK
jgi:hypothetical protein